MVLVDDGRLDLDAPVDDLLPELASPRVLRQLDSELDDTVPADRAITARDLLTGTAGHGFADVGVAGHRAADGAARPGRRRHP